MTDAKVMGLVYKAGTPLKAIRLRPETFPELSPQHLQPADVDKLQQWYYGMAMDARTGLTAQPYIFVTKLELENGDSIPARAMPVTELNKRFDFTYNDDDWFDLTVKPGREFYI